MQYPPVSPHPGAPLPPANLTPPRTGANILVVVGAIIVLTLAVVSVAVFALQKRAVTNPKTQAERFFAAAKAKDWKALYDLSEAPAQTFSDAATYAEKMNEGMQKMPLIAIAYEGMMVKPDIKVGEANIDGNSAAVSVTRSETAGGEPMTTTADLKMHNVDGVWKVAAENGYGNIVVGKFEFDSSKATVRTGPWKAVPNRNNGMAHLEAGGTIQAIHGFQGVPIPISPAEQTTATPPETPVNPDTPADAPADTGAGRTGMGMDFGNSRRVPPPQNAPGQAAPSTGSPAPNGTDAGNANPATPAPAGTSGGADGSTPNSSTPGGTGTNPPPSGSERGN